MTQDLVRRNNISFLSDRGRPIIFAHGFGCDQQMWRFVAPAFAADHRVILFDYVGAGKSDTSAYTAERYSTLAGYADDLLEICQALDLRDLILVGHSISGMIGLLASLQAPERFSELIMISSSACYLNDPPDYLGGFDREAIEELLDLMEKNYVGWASFMAPMAMKNAGRPELAQELEASFCAIDPLIAQQFARATFFTDNRPDLPRVTVPVLLLQCLEDAIVSPQAAAYLHEHLPASSLRQMHAVGHYPHLSNPEETIQHLKDYLLSMPHF